MTNEQLQFEIRRHTLDLRKAYYSGLEKEEETYNQPFGGSITESIGPWPEFILKGRFCNKSMKGFCSPCFYSRFPIISNSNISIENQLLSQVNYVVENFEELVIKNQHGIVAFSKSQQKYENNPVCLVFTPTGSYFDNKEYPQETRIKALNKLIEASFIHNVDVCLYIESHAEDFNNYDDKSILGKEEYSLLQKLNTRIIFGFESSNEFTRNTLYNKKLDINDYLKAIEKAKNLNFPVGSFVFVGIAPLNNLEVIIDAKETIQFLTKNEVTPVLMFNNVQAYTISELLFEVEYYKMIEPRTVLEIIYILLEQKRYEVDNIDNWLIADPIGGPPTPKYNIFSAKGKITCDKCTKDIYELIVKLRKNKNRNMFLEEYYAINKCNCSDNYTELLEKEKKQITSMKQRTEEMLSVIDVNKKAYLKNKNLSKKQIKAELLCYGVKVSENDLQILEKENPYIREKGFAHAINLVLGDEFINTCVNDEFCKKSPYSIKVENNNTLLYRDDEYITGISFLNLPDWCKNRINGIEIGGVMRPHSYNCVGCWPKLTCEYNCKFCCLPNISTSNQHISATIIGEMAKYAIQYNPEYEFALSGGVYKDSDKTALYYIEICKELKKVGVKYISVELAPPNNLDLIEELYNSGASALIMNIEVEDDNLRKNICPSKGNISKEYYYEALRKAVFVFGKGSVSSVLIYGIQNDENIVKCANELTDIDVMPTIIPFKPIDQCYMNGYNIVNPQSFLILHKRIYDAVLMKNILCKKNNACISCNGCTL